MKKALRFLKLDFITVKPYFTWKNLFLILAVPVLLMFFTDAGMGMLFFLMGYGALFVSYPFAVGEQNGIDALYVTLNVRRKEVVLGRYLFALCTDVFTCVVGIACMVAVSALKSIDLDWRTVFPVSCAALAFFSLVQAVQLPLFFRFGYAKAKILSMLPFLAVPVFVFLYDRAYRGESAVRLLTELGSWIDANNLLALAIAAVLWVFIMFISYDVSCLQYRKRDF